MNLFYSISLTVLGVLLLRRRLTRASGAAVLAMVVMTLLLASSFWFIADLLTGRGIDESVTYHLKADLTGAGLGDFRGPIALSIVLVVFSFATALFTYRSARAHVKPARRLWRELAAVSSLLAAGYLNPTLGDIRIMATDEVASTATITQTVSTSGKALTDIKFPARKRNLVVLYLESFERTYLDQTIFPGLAPHMVELEQQALSFSNIGQFYGDGWTIAGMVSSQCGVPLALPPAQGNAMSGMGHFLPGAICLGDILRFAGYELDFMGGANLKFAGKGAFFSTHGFSRIEGLNELKSKVPDPAYRHEWGLHDDTLMDLLKQRFDHLASGDQPFGLFALTVNTHHPKGIAAKSCHELQYRDGRDPSLNAIHCADRMVGDFVAYLQAHPAYQDTVIVLASDHLAMRNTASDELKRGNRKNLLLVLAKDLAARRIETAGALFDVAPTVLRVLGAEGSTSLGHGRDLLGTEATLAETVPDLAAYLRSRRNEANQLWQFPQLTKGLRMNPRGDRLDLDNTSIAVPALLLLGPELGVEEIKFQQGPWKLIEQVAELPFDQEFVWVDQCSRTAALSAGTSSTRESNFCAASGSLGATTVHVEPVGRFRQITLEDLRELRDPVRPKRERAAVRAEALRKAARYDMVPQPMRALEPQLRGSHVLVSSARRGGRSLVDNPLDPAATPTSLERGLTLLGLNHDASPVTLSHWDTCADGVTEAALSNYSFGDDITRLRAHFGAFAVMSHDSAVCGKRDLTEVFAGTGLEKWKDIGFRTPFIGVVTGSGNTHEFKAEAESSLAIEINGLFESTRKELPYRQRQSSHLPRVAHAGGAYEGKTYTNSLAALSFNRDRFRLFEMDFSWTTDGHLVCLHDWKEFWGHAEEQKESLDGFLEAVAHRPGPPGCTLESLAHWMERNPAAKIVTDVKEDNIRALAKIALDHPTLKARFIPQIYSAAEYRVVRELGFPDVIWTLYRMRATEEQILMHLGTMDLFALTMPMEVAQTGLAKSAARATGVLSYVHTLNSAEDLEYAKSLGANSIYTDKLSASSPSSP